MPPDTAQKQKQKRNGFIKNSVKMRKYFLFELKRFLRIFHFLLADFIFSQTKIEGKMGLHHFVLCSEYSALVEVTGASQKPVYHYPTWEVQLERKKKKYPNIHGHLEMEVRK